MAQLVFYDERPDTALERTGTQPKTFEIWASRRSALPVDFGRGERRESLNSKGVWAGFHKEVCRAAAGLGD